MDTCCQDKELELEQLRHHQARTLRIVLAVNATMFVLEFGVGLVAGSVALQADSLDMLGDSLVYGLSLYVLARNARWRASVALLKGSVMLLFGLGVLIETGLKFLAGGVPEAPSMGLMGGLALLANATCLILLTRHKADDLNMRSTWLCSRNDIIANTGVLLAAGLVLVTHSGLPDLLVGLVITAVFLQSALYVLRAGLRDWRTTVRPQPPTPIVPL
jgi:Co/Zn/Cd efflux system component